ncbi:aldo/keto reductase [Halalkalicoccus jeotgali]|uniref:Aldo/keto reductase n=1 Tax=Halalkalicoccus jeotgali (strain DSM 18796 / CECT 7217 / JCM 14584 / KCTC 4019 / B3) TaxID=795797 RepID=D8J7S9_HALJB|nr:aldo/keto reductase [Halalkalicoccus jeotgali]ADJ16099.1 aldo/keto reductase [Halalkalicoccus jeotgali B3]ELY38194.1 aldo/keto reductase [Halalkalicoccus jeotgali B3]
MAGNLPRVGLGTYSETNREQWVECVKTALEAGYRHIDTAQVYGNEEYVGEGIARSDVPREEVFLATKTVHVDVPGPTQTEIVESVEESLEKLRTEYVDLLYVHWPAGCYEPETTFGAFDDFHREGLVRNVGVSNFEPETLEEAREMSEAPIFANQVECHPFCQQAELREYAVEHDHWLVAYCPLARGEVFDDPVLGEIAEDHGTTEAQVSLAWLLSKENVAVVPRSTGERHIRENLAARDLDLNDEEIERIDGIEREHRLIDRDYAPWN